MYSSTTMATSQGGEPARQWTFLTNHARVLLEIARNPQARLRDMAAIAGITEQVIARVDLTDECGAPRCARLTPPALTHGQSD